MNIKPPFSLIYCSVKKIKKQYRETRASSDHTRKKYNDYFRQCSGLPEAKDQSYVIKDRYIYIYKYFTKESIICNNEHIYICFTTIVQYFISCI